jgi:hypothetical protein
MVLRQNRNYTRSCNLTGQIGITLIELLVSIALSSLVAIMAFAFFKDAGSAARRTQAHQGIGFQTQAVFSSLTENLLSGGGVLRLGQNRLILLNRQDKIMDYSLVDSTLSINGKALPMRIGEFKIEPIGPVKPEHKGSYRELEQAWELDSLDNDRDGQVTFQELDRDRDDSLSAEECRYVGLYQVRLTTIDHGLTTKLESFIHPRNHLAALTIQNWEVSEIGYGNAGF